MGHVDGQPRGMRVLVTGAAGFIGSHLCERLLADGHGVWGLDNFDAFYAPEAKRRNLSAALENPCMHLVEGDVRDEILLGGLFTSVPFDLVVHLAARPDSRSSVAHPDVCWDVNVTGTLRLLEAMRHHHVGRLIYGSSAEVYGRRSASSGHVVETEAADRPCSPYAASKRAGELLCHAWHGMGGLSLHCLRLFSVYGPRQRPDLLVGRLADMMLGGERLPITSDRAFGLDHIYVDDVVECLVRSARVLSELPAGEPAFELLNVGSGEAVTTAALADALSAALQVKYRVKRRSEPPRGLPWSPADLTASATVLGFTPRTRLEDGLRETVDWLRAGEPASAVGSPSFT